MNQPKPQDVDTATPPDAAAETARVRLAAGLFDELRAPPGLPETLGTGTFGGGDESDWLADASAQATALARADLLALSARVGSHVGPYRLTSLLGRGGMGAVFAAERSDGAFEQRVALKLIRTGGDVARLASRFRRERAILARLQHPNIARLLDGGLSAEGEPWFALELVEGVSLAGYCEARGLDLRARVQLFLQICDAVAYAHRNLIVHRDLKPANVLVTAQGEARLLDFGIAKLLDRTSSGTELTRADERVLTPDYAAPEQILGQPITTATDVYALGLLLYEMLTGQRAQRVTGKGVLEAERWVVNHEIPRPSSTPSGQARALQGDLDAIVGKALRKEPERRYDGAQTLAEDLRRHLAGQSVRARGDAWSYRTGTFVRRNKLALGATAAVMLALLLGMLAALWQAHEARLQADRAQAVKKFVIDLFEGIHPALAGRGGREISALELLDRGIERISEQLDTQPGDQAELLIELADMYQALGRARTALELSERALALQNEAFGPDDARLVPALARIALSESSRGRLSESRDRAQHAERLLASADRSYDADRLRVLQAQLLITNRAGLFAESERIALRTLALQRERFGADSPQCAIGLVSLAWAYSWQNRYDEADALFRQALDLYLQSGVNRAAMAFLSSPEAIHFQLGNIASFRGRYREARDRFEQAMAITKAKLGPDHPATRGTQESLYKMDFYLGRAAEAESGLRTIRNSRTREEADRGEFAGWGLAVVLAGRGKIEEAETLIRAQSARTRDDYGPSAKLTQLIARDFGAILIERGVWSEANVVLGAAMAELQRLETDTSYQYALVESRYARLLLAQGDAPAAERRARHAHAVLRDRIGVDFDETARAGHELGRALVALGRHDEGVTHLRAAADNYARQFGTSDVRTAEFRFVLGEALQQLGTAEAKTLLDAAARDLVAVEGNTLPVRARAERWLAASR